MRTNGGKQDVVPTGVSRLAWVDSGRGIAICLVALFHTTNWLLAAGAGVQGWSEFNLVVSSLRMPLFFVLSGLFASKWLAVGWRELWRGKLSLFVWVFLVWSVIGVGAFTLGVRVLKGQGSLVEGTIVPMLLAPVAPRLELWFIWALALFFALAKLTARVDVRLQLAVAGVASAAALSGWDTASPGWSGAVRYYGFFLAGLYCRALVIRLGQTRRPAVLGAWFVAWLVVSLTLWQWGLREIPGLYFLNCVLGVGAGVALARLVRVGVISRIGSRTLPIYLAHTTVVVVISSLLHVSDVSLMEAGALLLPPVIVVVAIWVGLQLGDRLPRLGLGFLYAPPAWFVGRAGRRVVVVGFDATSDEQRLTRAEPS